MGSLWKWGPALWWRGAEQRMKWLLNTTQHSHGVCHCVTDIFPAPVIKCPGIRHGWTLDCLGKHSGQGHQHLCWRGSVSGWSSPFPYELIPNIVEQGQKGSQLLTAALLLLQGRQAQTDGTCWCSRPASTTCVVSSHTSRTFSILLWKHHCRGQQPIWQRAGALSPQSLLAATVWC